MLLAGLVLVLGLLGASPTLHAELHHGDDHDHHAQAHDDTGCAVLLYAQGVTTPTEPPTVQPPVAIDSPTVFPLPADPLLPVATHRLPAGRAPPVIR